MEQIVKRIALLVMLIGLCGCTYSENGCLVGHYCLIPFNVDGGRSDSGAALLSYSAAMFRASNPQVAPVWNPQCHEVLSVYGDMLACQ
jgi:hypothetical protein